MQDFVHQPKTLKASYIKSLAFTRRAARGQESAESSHGTFHFEVQFGSFRKLGVPYFRTFYHTFKHVAQKTCFHNSHKHTRRPTEAATYFGVLIIRILLFRVLYLGPETIFGNPHLSRNFIAMAPIETPEITALV